MNKMPQTIYTKKEIDVIVDELKAMIPQPMPDEVKAALKTVLEWLVSTI